MGKKFFNTECSSFKRKNNTLTSTLHTFEKEKGTPHSRIPLLNGGLHGLQIEKEKVTESLKGLSTAICMYKCSMLFKNDLMHLEGKELDLNRYSTRDEWLISGMECANSELKGNFPRFHPFTFYSMNMSRIIIQIVSIMNRLAEGERTYVQ